MRISVLSRVVYECTSESCLTGSRWLCIEFCIEVTPWSLLKRSLKTKSLRITTQMREFTYARPVHVTNWSICAECAIVSASRRFVCSGKSTTRMVWGSKAVYRRSCRTRAWTWRCFCNKKHFYNVLMHKASHVKFEPLMTGTTRAWDGS